MLIEFIKSRYSNNGTRVDFVEGKFVIIRTIRMSTKYSEIPDLNTPDTPFRFKTGKKGPYVYIVAKMKFNDFCNDVLADILNTPIGKIDEPGGLLAVLDSEVELMLNKIKLQLLKKKWEYDDVILRPRLLEEKIKKYI